MRWLSALALLPLLAGGLLAREETGVSCDLRALRFEPAGHLLAIYDGVRRGLEKAHLGRVCLEPIEGPGPKLDAFVRRLEAEQREAAAGRRAAPVAFGLGDGAAAALARRATDVPRVLVVRRYTAGGRPLAPLPDPEGPSAVVYADLPLERVGRVLAELTGRPHPRVLLALAATPERAAPGLARAAEASGLAGLGRAAPEDGPADAVLHLALGLGETPMPFADAVRLARDRRIPLVTDDALRYRQGLAAVVLTTQADLVGRTAAEAARVLTRHPGRRLPARGVGRLRVLVDLDAADRQGLTLPLPFLARAAELHRGPRPVPAAGASR